VFIQVDMRSGRYRWEQWITVIQVLMDDAINLGVDFITGQGIHSSANTARTPFTVTTLLWLLCDAAVDPSLRQCFYCQFTGLASVILSSSLEIGAVAGFTINKVIVLVSMELGIDD
jgi:hypothetical protein